jgi:glycosyltransferase involved in cell wall biosynthesis
VQVRLFRPDLPRDVKAPRGTTARVRLGSDYVRAYFRLARSLEREAAALGCRLLFASRPFAWAVASRVGARLGLPVVWRAGTHFEHWAQPSLLAYLAGRTPPRAVVYTSESVKEALSPFVDAPSLVIHNGVDTARFSPARALPSLRDELSLGPRAQVVAFVGRIAPEKGTELFIESCRRFGALAPRAQVLVAGDSGWRAWFEARLAAAGLSSRVRLLGFVREVERVYAAADVVLNTSSDEGCPNALLEAMAMGRAVVATAVGGTREIVRPGIDGLLARAGDAEQIARAVAALLEQPERREQLGLNAAQAVRRRFTLDRQVERLACALRWAARGEGRPHDELDGGAAA